MLTPDTLPDPQPRPDQDQGSDVPPGGCTVDTDCGANTGSETLDTGLPWDYLTCNAGACDL